ncbi:slipin family protein [Bacteroidetes/Chlorobi group bacterium ChocPot_Mid]|jgi:regulator of protease activity HflC (stomatin/prohibitin superfamily)|nr:MAG: slipin family protein [Bacteroidetes/Chlorobi group bacterium ChocPot_Mid]
MPQLVILVFILLIIMSSIKVMREYERAVVFRLGRLIAVKGPGLIILIPFIDKMIRVSLRTVVMDIEPQDVITKDNVSIKVNAVLYFRVMEADKAIVDVENYLFATNQLAQTTLRSILGQSDLDEILAEREKINHRLQQIIDDHTEPWGIKVSSVEVKQIDLPIEMQRAMARQAEAERERRAKVINADGEYQAARKLADAAQQIQEFPIALQLRFLQTLSDIATEKNSTIVFPVPIDLLTPFMEGAQSKAKEIISKISNELENKE